MRVEFHPLAEEEFIEAACYYEEHLEGLGFSFIADMESNLEALEKHPELGAKIETPFRLSPLRRFPHSTIYTIEAGRILIVAVAHQRRRPGFWKEHLGR